MTLPAMLTLTAWCIGIPILAAWGKLRFWDWMTSEIDGAACG